MLSRSAQFSGAIAVVRAFTTSFSATAIQGKNHC
jgi:hypothetical protein